MNKKYNDVMTVEECAEYLGIPRSSVYKLAQESRIPSQKVGKYWRFYKEAIEEWVKGALITSSK